MPVIEAISCMVVMFALLVTTDYLLVTTDYLLVTTDYLLWGRQRARKQRDEAIFALTALVDECNADHGMNTTVEECLNAARDYIEYAKH